MAKIKRAFINSPERLLVWLGKKVYGKCEYSFIIKLLRRKKKEFYAEY